MSFKDELCQNLNVSELELITQLNIICHSKEELYEFFLEECKDLLEKYGIDSKEKLADIFLEELTYKYLSNEEINTLKEDLLRGKSEYDILKLLHLFSIDELSRDDIRKAINKPDLLDEYVDYLLKVFINNKYFCLTIDPAILTNDNINLLGIENIERLCSYSKTEYIILEVLNDQRKRIFFEATVGLIRTNTDNPCADIEKLAVAINSSNLEDLKGIDDANELLFVLMSKEELISNEVYEQQIKNCATLEELKQNVLKRLFCVNLDEALKIIRKYGKDIEKLYTEEKNYKNRLYIEQIINMKKVIECNDLFTLLNLYEELFILEVISPYEFRNFYQMKVRESYAKSINDCINDHTSEVIDEADEYVVYDISDDFSRMVTVVDAYGEESKGSFLREKWETPESRINHARCYSLVGDANFGIYYKGYAEDALIVSINRFPASGLVAGANRDIGSNSLKNISEFIDEEYMLGKNYFNNIRGKDNYSEFVIENDDDLVSQIHSFVCIDEVNENTIMAAKEIYNSTGKKAIIEIVKPLSIIKKHEKYIQEKLELFRELKDIDALIDGLVVINNDISAFCRGMTPNDVLENQYDRSIQPYARFAKNFNQDNAIHNDKNICALIEDAYQMFRDNPSKIAELNEKILREISKGNLNNSYYWRLNLEKEKEQINSL